LGDETREFTTVTDGAVRHGFRHPEHVGADYRRTFGQPIRNVEEVDDLLELGLYLIPAPDVFERAFCSSRP
jgi:hypothetical protein